MLDYRLLYQTKDRIQWFVQEYCAGMNHIARVTDGSLLAGVKGDIGLTDLQRVTTGLTDCSQYLFATDTFGKQFHIALTGTIQDAWYQCMQLGLGTVDALAGKTFNILNTWATAVYNSILTKIAADDQLFLSGHGLGGAVAALAGIKLKKAGKKIQQVYINGAVGFITPEMQVEFNGDGTNGVTLPVWWMGFPEDELSWAPPSPLFYGNWWAAGVPAVGEVLLPGMGQNWARLGQQRQRLADLLDVNDPLGWPARITDTMNSYHTTDYYIRQMRRWTVNNEFTRGKLKELIDTLNANYALGMPALGQ